MASQDGNVSFSHWVHNKLHTSNALRYHFCLLCVMARYRSACPFLYANDCRNLWFDLVPLVLGLLSFLFASLLKVRGSWYLRFGGLAD